MSSFSYVLFAFSEILGSITGLEYAFTKAPKNMRSLVISVFFLTSAFATALHEALACKTSLGPHFVICAQYNLQLSPLTHFSFGDMVPWVFSPSSPLHFSGGP